MTILFTDIVGSTERAAKVGDRAWRELLDRHHAFARASIERAGGRMIKSIGDGVLASFDGPGRAIDAASEISVGEPNLDLHIRAGLHVGEIELMPGDVAGIAVHVAARVAALAAPERDPREQHRARPRRRFGHRLRGPREPSPEGSTRSMAAVCGRLGWGVVARSRPITARVSSSTPSTLRRPTSHGCGGEPMLTGASPRTYGSATRVVAVPDAGQTRTAKKGTAPNGLDTGREE